MRLQDSAPKSTNYDGAYCVNIGDIEGVMVDKYQLYLDGETELGEIVFIRY